MWAKPQLMMWTANLLYVTAGALLLYAALFWMIHLPLFQLRQIKVKGEVEHVTQQQVQYIVQRELQGNFFTLDPARIRKAFEKLPWVRNVSVRRHWPDRVEVTLEEHTALARWGNAALVNTHGELFQAASDEGLPMFDGPVEDVREMAQHYQQFRRMLEPLKLHPVQLELNRRRAWQLRLNNGLAMELGREQVQARLGRFVAVYQRMGGESAVPASYADLRYPNGFAVRRPGRAPLAASGNRA